MTLPDKLERGTVMTTELNREIERRYNSYLTLEQEGKKDYADMRKFQAKYVTSDREVRRLQDEIATLRTQAGIFNSRHEEDQQQLAAKDAEIDEESHLRERMSKLLALTAIALKGPNEELSLHSWHDLPEKAEELQQQLAAKDALLLRAQTIMRHAWRTWYFPRGWEPLSDEQREFDATLAAIDKELKP